MSFITFIYKIEDNEKIFYGKIIYDYLSEIQEGYDKEIKLNIIDGINKVRKQEGLDNLNKKIFLGILSFTTNKYIFPFSSEEEIKCFDFYYKIIKNNKTTFINGILIE